LQAVLLMHSGKTHSLPQTFKFTPSVSTYKTSNGERLACLWRKLATTAGNRLQKKP